MKKKTQIAIIWLVVTLLAITGCDSSASRLKTFQPEKDSPFKITFSYPSVWVWELDINSDINDAGITVYEPYSASEGVNEKSRLIGIDVRIDANPQVKIQERIATHLAGIDFSDTIELLENKTLTIDDHFANWLTVSHAWESTNPGVTYLQEFIYLLAEDRYYTITLYIPESEVGGRFHAEFKAMVESVRFLP